MRFASAIALALLSAFAPTRAADDSTLAQGVSPTLVQQALSAFYTEHAELPRDGSGPWIELIGKAGGPEELRKLFT